MIIPSIDLLGGRAVQLRRGRELVVDGGDPMEWLDRFAVVGEVAVVDLDAALGIGSNTATIRKMLRRAPCRVGGGIRDVNSARAWLDAEASRVVIGTAASPSFCAQLPRDRVIAAVDSEHGRVVVDGWRTSTGLSTTQLIRELAPFVGGFLLTQVEHEGGMAGFDPGLVESAIKAADGVRITAAGGITTDAEIGALDRLGVDAQVGMALYTGRLALGQAFAASLREGTGALWPVVVCDESGRSLGLAWTNRDTLARAVDERAGIYWSRSRKAVWVKGESSGCRQQLIAVELDCDCDAIRFIVRQEGTGFCHRGTRSCFGDRFDLGALERVIAERLQGDAAESRTRRLAHQPGLLASKLREEAEELANADAREDVVHESADLLYVLLTAVVRSGATLADVEAELTRRHRMVSRRPMVAKS